MLNWYYNYLHIFFITAIENIMIYGAAAPIKEEFIDGSLLCLFICLIFGGHKHMNTIYSISIYMFWAATSFFVFSTYAEEKIILLLSEP